MLLEDHGMVVCVEAGTAGQALPEIAAQQPEVILLDVVLPDGDGLELIQSLRKVCPDARILVVSGQEENLYAHLALRHGADGYVAKGSPLDTIVAAVEQVKSGGTYLSDRIKKLAVFPLEGKDLLARLTPREMEVFGHLGATASNQEIAAKMALSEKTIRYHRSNISRKLGLEHPGGLLQHARAWQMMQAKADGAAE